VVFAATGTNLVADDGNGVSDVFESRLTSAPAFTYTVRISEEDYNKALQAAAFYGTTVDALAQRGTWTLAFIVKRSGGSPSPAADQPNDGPVVIHTTYTADNDWITGYITDEFALSNGDDMHVLGLRFMIFAWMLETGQA
jgi:hypothetical protein